jgi:hypothetical protein
LKKLPKPIEKKGFFFWFPKFHKSWQNFQIQDIPSTTPVSNRIYSKNTYFRAVVLMEKIMNMFYLKIASAQPFKYAKKWKRYDNLTI